MPIVDGRLIVNFELTTAERLVRFADLNAHILRQRVALEAATMPLAKRIGFLAGSAINAPVLVAELATKLERLLGVTYDVGYREVQREIRALRSATTAAREEDVRPGRAKGRMKARAEKVAKDVQRAAAEGDDPISASGKAQRALHDGVLTLVGETLNAGRAWGALEMPGGAPTFAMRSEMLDRNLCEQCSSLHGTIVPVESDDYFALLPPANCLGSGRCRGVMIHADGISDLRQPED